MYIYTYMLAHISVYKCMFNYIPIYTSIHIADKMLSMYGHVPVSGSMTICKCACACLSLSCSEWGQLAVLLDCAASEAEKSNYIKMLL